MMTNFVEQIIAVKEDILQASSNTANYWQDDNKERFYYSYINVYDNKLDLFINGGPEIYGMGLDELLTFLDQKEREMEMLGRF